LTRPRDFERYVGQAARITLAEPVENQKHWVGRLSAFADNTITLEVAPGKTVQFGLDKVQKANLKFDW
jgi:ribosome maturation factor RimP